MPITVKTILRYLTDPHYRFVNNARRGGYQDMPDEAYIRRMFRAKMGYDLPLENPQTFNEKLQWLKLHDRRDIYTRMVDKCEAKAFAADTIGSQYVIPTLGVWKRAEDIDFSQLPDRFVLKCTHDSHGLVICKDKSQLNIPAAVEKLNKCLRRSYYKYLREWPYKNVEPRIIAEQYVDNAGQDLADYKIHCFHGEPKVILVCQDRFAATGLTEDFFDCDWNHLNVSRTQHGNAPKAVPRPPELEEMLRLSRVLSQGIPFVRCDFFVADGRVLFGEMTFYPASGFKPFSPPSFDKTLGDFLTLPEEK
ncbi:MAG: glycosyl transferase [Clostridia bacterium]|nr:glycosyl transferase [Clostridia bacterium]